jgi:hypothetical protein
MGRPERAEAGPSWRRIVRHGLDGRVLDWVEVGQCAACGRGVDREFPSEYRDVAGTLFCRVCAPPLAEPGASAVGRDDQDVALFRG